MREEERDNMRIVYTNMHCNGFLVNDFRNIIAKNHFSLKNRYLLDYLLKQDVEIINFVTPESSRLLLPVVRKLTKNAVCRKLEACFVLYKNGISCRQVKSEYNPRKIREDDIVICYSTFDDEAVACLKNLKGIKVIDMAHFYGDSRRAELLKNIEFQYYMFEVDLGKYSLLYRKNYQWNHAKFIERPYAVQNRFQNKKKFSERKKKALGIGNVMFVEEHPEFLEIYGDDVFQPHRKMIYDAQDSLQDILDSRISCIQREDKPAMEIVSSDPLFIKFQKEWHNVFRAGRREKQHSFDMVDVLNNYMMFTCGEDVHGSYGIGSLEGMACGTAMIGSNYGGFEDLGMKAGFHYISYDGTIENLREVIEYYIKPEHYTELETIAANGSAFVAKNFSEAAAGKCYYDSLQKIAKGLI